MNYYMLFKVEKYAYDVFAMLTYYLEVKPIFHAINYTRVFINRLNGSKMVKNQSLGLVL